MGADEAADAEDAEAAVLAAALAACADTPAGRYVDAVRLAAMRSSTLAPVEVMRVIAKRLPGGNPAVL
ncbi:hypothetical protein ACFJIX_24780 [Roseateles sp. UC29_93]|uniref:hypothetical protein n=1 Tax=Roseateles sp. UC29_93 TaxID=3350177 RepID=UPI00366EB3E1